MRYTKRMVLIAILIWACLVPDCTARTAPGKANPHHPTALELLGKYTQALDSVWSHIIKAEVVRESKMRFDKNFPHPFLR